MNLGKKEKVKTTKQKTMLMLAVFIFLLGLSIALYPVLSAFLNQKNMSEAVVAYEQSLGNQTDSNKQKWLEEAKSYNAGLVDLPQSYVDGSPKNASYKDLAQLVDPDMLGYIEIEKLDLLLPIYHGTEKENLAKGLGHLEGSSLPLGEVNTHAVITGHRGLANAKLLSDLDKLELGDRFTVIIVDRVIEYEVDDIRVVTPNNVDSLDIVEGKSYITLVTCTPYAVNTHRLLVRATQLDVKIAS